MFEGGYRVPCLMRMPGTIPAGTETGEFCVTFDLLPTVAKLLGVELPAESARLTARTWLSSSVTMALSRRMRNFTATTTVGCMLSRDWRWKLHLPHVYRTLDGKPGGEGGYPVVYAESKTGVELYDLQNDVGETKNVAAEHPEGVARLMAAAECALGRSLGRRADPA